MHYDVHADTMDLYAANRVAAKQAIRDEMPMTAERHERLATHIQNASDWARANCPPGYRIQSTIRFEAVPDVNPVYNGSRGDIYSRKEA